MKRTRLQRIPDSLHRKISLEAARQGVTRQKILEEFDVLFDELLGRRRR